MFSSIILAFLLATLEMAAGQGNLEISDVKVTTIMREPYMMLKDGCTKLSKDCARGFTKDLLDQLSEDMGFQYTLKAVDDGKYGAFDGSKWTGLIGEVQAQKADVAAADITLTHLRSQVVDFTTPYWTSSLAVLMKKLPSAAEGGGVFTVLTVFNVIVWILILVSILVVVVIFLVINHLSPIEGRRLAAKGKCAAEEADAFGLFGSLWFAFSNLCWQGFDRTPKSISGRVLTIFWWVFALFMIVTFTAGVISFFGVNHLSMNTLSDLDDADEVQIGCFSGGATYRFLQNTKVDAYRSLFFKVDKAGNLFQSTSEAIERIKQGNYAAILEGPSADYHAARDCDLGILPERIKSLERSSSYAYALRPGLPNLLKAINTKIIQYQSDGTFFQLYQKWWLTVNSTCDPQRKVGSRPYSSKALGLGNVAAPFVILIVGIVFALIALGLEILAEKLNCFKGSSPTGEEEERKGGDADGKKPTGDAAGTDEVETP